MHQAGDRRRAIVRGGERAERVAQIASAIGIEVVASGPAELAILETDDAAEVLSVGVRALVIAPRRVWHAQVSALMAAGARRVLDSEATVLDVLIALVEIAFSTSAEQRRWWRRGDGLALELSAGGAAIRGRLLGISRTSVVALLSSPLPDGARVEIGIATPAGRAQACGFVAYSAEDGVAIELDLCGADTSSRLVRTERRAPRAPGRARP